MKKIASLLIIISLFSFGSLAFGQQDNPDGPVLSNDGQTTPDGPVIDNGSTSNDTNFSGLKNPISVSSLPELVAKILDIVLTIGVPIVAFFIIYSGFKFVMARGNEEKLKEAKQSILYTLIGAALLLGAWVLATAIDSIIDSIKSVA